MHEPLVTVVITTYKRPDALYTAICSVLNQTYANFELIIVDDNDPDTEYRKETERIVGKFKNEPKIMFIKHEKNSGGSAARNSGAKIAKGKYVAFYDDDDEWFSNKLEKQIEYFESCTPEVGAIYCSYILVGRTKEKEIIRTENGRLTKAILFQKFDPGASSTLVFKKEALEHIGYFNEAFVRHQDLEVLIRLFENYEIDVCPDILLKINGHSVISADKIVQIKKFFLNAFSDSIKKLSFWERNKCKAIHTLQIAIQYKSEKKIVSFMRYYLLAFFTYPFLVMYIMILINIVILPFKTLNNRLEMYFGA